MLVERKQFEKALERVAKIKNRNTLPILDNFLLVLKGGELSVSASDLDYTAKVTIPAVGDDFKATLPKEALKLIGKLKSETITIIPGEFSVDIISSGRVSNYGTQTPEDYPETPAVGEAVSVDIPLLQSVLKRSLPFIANDETRPVMCALWFKPNKAGTLEIAGSDAHAICITDTGIPFTSRLSVPNPELLTKLLTEEPVTLNIGSMYSSVTQGGFECVFRNVDGEIPDYDSILPVPTGSFKVVLKDLLAELDMAKLFNEMMFKLSILDSAITISASDEDFARSTKSKLPSDVKADFRGDIGFEYKNILKGLKACYGKDVEIHLIDATRLVQIFEGNFKVGIMPAYLGD